MRQSPRFSPLRRSRPAALMQEEADAELRGKGADDPTASPLVAARAEVTRCSAGAAQTRAEPGSTGPAPAARARTRSALFREQHSRGASTTRPQRATSMVLAASVRLLLTPGGAQVDARCRAGVAESPSSVSVALLGQQQLPWTRPRAAPKSRSTRPPPAAVVGAAATNADAALVLSPHPGVRGMGAPRPLRLASRSGLAMPLPLSDRQFGRLTAWRRGAATPTTRSHDPSCPVAVTRAARSGPEVAGPLPCLGGTAAPRWTNPEMWRHSASSGSSVVRTAPPAGVAVRALAHAISRPRSQVRAAQGRDRA